MSARTFVVRRVEPGVAVVIVVLAATAFVATVQAEPQESKSQPEARVIVVGEGSISVPPDYAQIRSGVSTTAKTVKEANDANVKAMTAITASLLDFGVLQKDIQTSRF